MDQVTIIGSVIYTLNKVEVKGKENLMHLLGCINTLENLKNTMAGEVMNDDVENQ